QFGTNAFTTRINCVIRVLQESIEIVKMSLILPHILENPHEARRVLSFTKYQPAVGLLKEYIVRRDIVIREKRSPLSDHGMIKIIDYFQRNYKMYDLFSNLYKKLTFNEKYFLTTFERLYKVCEHHLLRSSKREINNERQLNMIYQENEAIKVKIEKLKEELANQVVRERWKMAAKMVYLHKCEKELLWKRQINEQRMRNESESCQRTIRMNQKNFVEEQLMLEDQIKPLREAFDKQFKMNQRELKSLRDEKNKLELQVEASIRKYDSTIRQKMVKHFDLQEELVKSKEELDKVIKEYKINEAIYNDIVLKYENVAVEYHKRRILSFMVNRAARKIQKYWRKWHKAQKRKAQLERRKKQKK
ncbi:hypothetical protein KR044_006676, partial [Drosophila immigrans]